MDEVAEGVEPDDDFIPGDDAPETVEQAYRRIEANIFWAKVAREEYDTEAARLWKQDEDDKIMALHVGADVVNVRDLIEWRVRLRHRALDLWDELYRLGCSVSVIHGALRIHPERLVPPSILMECLAPPMREALEGICDEWPEVCNG